MLSQQQRREDIHGHIEFQYYICIWASMHNFGTYHINAQKPPLKACEGAIIMSNFLMANEGSGETACMTCRLV